eukprot:5411807-Prymnesium_polylepis.1
MGLHRDFATDSILVATGVFRVEVKTLQCPNPPLACAHAHAHRARTAYARVYLQVTTPTATARVARAEGNNAWSDGKLTAPSFGVTVSRVRRGACATACGAVARVWSKVALPSYGRRLRPRWP